MSNQVTIEVHFEIEYSPRKILSNGIDSGWRVGFHDRISYLLPDDDYFEWQIQEASSFNLGDFVAKFSESGKIGINITLDQEHDAGCEVVIYPQWMFFQLIGNLHKLNPRIIDFSSYLRKLDAFLQSIRFNCIKCEQF